MPELRNGDDQPTSLASNGDDLAAQADLMLAAVREQITDLIKRLGCVTVS